MGNGIVRRAIGDVKDKYGNQVFEHDIIKGVIVIDLDSEPEHFCVVAKNDVDTYSLLNIADEFEVIGNEYDSKE